jgi:hypothetical protein
MIHGCATAVVRHAAQRCVAQSSVLTCPGARPRQLSLSASVGAYTLVTAWRYEVEPLLITRMAVNV